MYVYFVSTRHFHQMFLFYYFLCIEIKNFQNILTNFDQLPNRNFHIFSFFPTNVNIFLNLLIYTREVTSFPAKMRSISRIPTYLIYIERH